MKYFISGKFPFFWQFLKKIKQRLLNLRSREKIFTNIFQDNNWGDEQSVSGPGSNMKNTKNLREFLPKIIRKYSINSIIDVPCGDFYWMSKIDLENISYLGVDIVNDIIESNTQKFSTNNISFTKKDILTSPFPKADLLICRDLMIHLPYELCIQIFTRLKTDFDFKYVLMSSYSGVGNNVEIEVGGFRPINLQTAPFSLPTPIESIVDDFSNVSKHLCLWKCSDIKASSIK